ncbi:hypothetical protein ACNTMW_28520 [Planosporangium sp. 12N6]|uniref:hypothetical protein n=1 Tax=Planosporangium spinosum TaxID=3402278 RepID=UPI003CFB2DBA
MRNRVRVAVGSLIMMGALGTVAACGSSSPATGATDAAPGQGGMQAYAACLSKHGVTLPSAFPRGNRPSGRPSGFPTARPSAEPDGSRRPGGPGGFGNQPPAGVDAATWQQAQQACASLRPSAGPRNGRNGAATAYRNCLADHGVTASRGPDALDANDPTVAAALKACEPLRPTARPTPGPTG